MVLHTMGRPCACNQAKGILEAKHLQKYGLIYQFQKHFNYYGRFCVSICGFPQIIAKQIERGSNAPEVRIWKMMHCSF